MQMSNQDSSQNSINQFRLLASKTDQDLLEKYSDADRAWLCSFIETELVDASPPSMDSPRDFVQVVRSLEASKRDWSRHYGDVILELHADDLESRQKAEETLLQFATNCPWLFLRRSATSRMS
jgi:hypothetical protein